MQIAWPVVSLSESFVTKASPQSELTVRAVAYWIAVRLPPKLVPSKAVLLLLVYPCPESLGAPLALYQECHRRGPLLLSCAHLGCSAVPACGCPCGWRHCQQQLPWRVRPLHPRCAAGPHPGPGAGRPLVAGPLHGPLRHAHPVQDGQQGDARLPHLTPLTPYFSVGQQLRLPAFSLGKYSSDATLAMDLLICAGCSHSSRPSLTPLPLVAPRAPCPRPVPLLP